MKLHSTVIICNDCENMLSFYTGALQQEIEVDFGNCIGFKTNISP